MEISHFLIILCFLISLQNIFIRCSFAADTITPIHSLKDGDKSTNLVSSGQNFELGFFSSPKNSNNRYLGIWYRVTPDIVVWVANRNNPLNDSFGELTIDNKGDLVLLDREKSAVWSSNSSRQAAKGAIARLLDSGNLVLGESELRLRSESYLWQSFDQPSDTLLPGMKLGWDLRIGLQRNLTSWKSADDPSNGEFTWSMELKGLPHMLLMSGSTRKVIRGGPWNGVEFNGYPLRPNTAYWPKLVMKENESYFVFENDVSLFHIRITLNYTGQLQCFALQSSNNEWELMFSTPYDPCDEYGKCGTNSICNLSGDPFCQCLEGFVSSSQEEWKVGNQSNGCVRKTLLVCSRRDWFVKLGGLKLPDFLRFKYNADLSLENCENECLKDCSCVAYANSNVKGGGSGCLMWIDNLTDVRVLRVEGTKQDIYIKLSASDFKSIGNGDKRKRLKVILAASISSSMFMILGLIFVSWIVRRIRGNSEDNDDIDLPLFNLDTVKTATKDFSPENMIGEGGFGPVYKGNLLTGQEMAVKRLSKNSRQGLKEFKNEVELIAKLQHKNLVALLGCCVQGDERILIYEYMSCKSLDHYIFDKKRNNLSSWEKNYKILMGIARGLLYLHQDSKLPIIHRDLKAANVLLDGYMNPKISDFGLARIFTDDEEENRTNTVVGT